ncbi:hypothetical protein BBW65_07565 [Helicobacter enhydrae]|uniref:Outer membrane beta-barrel protein n=1 Tax=Helicobacter enhydrae TaxID=222136 RepID=A0A1B1U7A6_9HELI|nr:hypothetical protein [Helicobacter enhydrae]ANV98663.1 hypothetical protein BBW65_07565 [Helicobacter enhydrae]
MKFCLKKCLVSVACVGLLSHLSAAETKSGAFVGIGGSISGIHINQQLKLNQLNPSGNQQKLVYSGGLLLGYQHYFNQNNALQTQIFVGSGFPVKYVAKDSREDQNPSGGSHQDKYQASELRTETIPIVKTNVEIVYLLDFLNQGEHTLGLNLGGGYQLDFYLRKMVYYGEIHGFKGDLFSSSANSLTHTFYPKVGLHYYYGRHQFNVDYHFGGILSGKEVEFANTKKIIEKYSASSLSYTIQTIPSYASFSYSYRF